MSTFNAPPYRDFVGTMHMSHDMISLNGISDFLLLESARRNHEGETKHGI
jgi:hypothetical protein